MEETAKLKSQKKEEWTSVDYNNICQKVLLPTQDVCIWVEHISLTKERRKVGAEKAPETKARKRKHNQGKITLSEPATFITDILV